jgi:hypothetical protein
MPIRRIETPRGVRYSEGGRFIDSRRGAREYVRENIDIIRNNRTRGFRYEDLTTRERQSYSAQNRYRYNGQYVRNPFNYLRQFESVTQGNRNLENFYSREDLRQLERDAFTLPYTADRNGDGDGLRLRGEFTDIAVQIRDYLSQQYDFNLITDAGEDLQGMRALEYLRAWETRIIERYRVEGSENGRTLDRIRINYEIRVNPATQQIDLNLMDIDNERDIEAWFDTP